ncbi:uncharacterized protein [Panulirus ornatus]|uniref:uncharacterized protein isoform X5 n=1 Tax=Panulirus ornatus TaxID=150431 RepID=UPI003A85060A
MMHEAPSSGNSLDITGSDSVVATTNVNLLTDSSHAGTPSSVHTDGANTATTEPTFTAGANVLENTHVMSTSDAVVIDETTDPKNAVDAAILITNAADNTNTDESNTTDTADMVIRNASGAHVMHSNDSDMTKSVDKDRTYSDETYLESASDTGITSTADLKKAVNTVITNIANTNISHITNGELASIRDDDSVHSDITSERSTADSEITTTGGPKDKDINPVESHNRGVIESDTRNTAFTEIISSSSDDNTSKADNDIRDTGNAEVNTSAENDSMKTVVVEVGNKSYQEIINTVETEIRNTTNAEVTNTVDDDCRMTTNSEVRNIVNSEVTCTTNTHDKRMADYDLSDAFDTGMISGNYCENSMRVDTPANVDVTSIVGKGSSNKDVRNTDDSEITSTSDDTHTTCTDITTTTESGNRNIVNDDIFITVGTDDKHTEDVDESQVITAAEVGEDYRRAQTQEPDLPDVCAIENVPTEGEVTSSVDSKPANEEPSPRLANPIDNDKASSHLASSAANDKASSDLASTTADDITSSDLYSRKDLDVHVRYSDEGIKTMTFNTSKEGDTGVVNTGNNANPRPAGDMNIDSGYVSSATHNSDVNTISSAPATEDVTLSAITDNIFRSVTPMAEAGVPEDILHTSCNTAEVELCPIDSETSGFRTPSVPADDVDGRPLLDCARADGVRESSDMSMLSDDWVVFCLTSEREPDHNTKNEDVNRSSEDNHIPPPPQVRGGMAPSSSQVDVLSETLITQDNIVNQDEFTEEYSKAVGESRRNYESLSLADRRSFFKNSKQTPVNEEESSDNDAIEVLPTNDSGKVEHPPSKQDDAIKLESATQEQDHVPEKKDVTYDPMTKQNFDEVIRNESEGGENGGKMTTCQQNCDTSSASHVTQGPDATTPTVSDCPPPKPKRLFLRRLSSEPKNTENNDNTSKLKESSVDVQASNTPAKPPTRPVRRKKIRKQPTVTAQVDNTIVTPQNTETLRENEAILYKENELSGDCGSSSEGEATEDPLGKQVPPERGPHDPGKVRPEVNTNDSGGVRTSSCDGDESDVPPEENGMVEVSRDAIIDDVEDILLRSEEDSKLAVTETTNAPGKPPAESFFDFEVSSGDGARQRKGECNHDTNSAVIEDLVTSNPDTMISQQTGETLDIEENEKLEAKETLDKDDVNDNDNISTNTTEAVLVSASHIPSCDTEGVMEDVSASHVEYRDVQTDVRSSSAIAIPEKDQEFPRPPARKRKTSPSVRSELPESIQATITPDTKDTFRSLQSTPKAPGRTNRFHSLPRRNKPQAMPPSTPNVHTSSNRRPVARAASTATCRPLNTSGELKFSCPEISSVVNYDPILFPRQPERVSVMLLSESREEFDASPSKRHTSTPLPEKRNRTVSEGSSEGSTHVEKKKDNTMRRTGSLRKRLYSTLQHNFGKKILHQPKNGEKVSCFPKIFGRKQNYDMQCSPSTPSEIPELAPFVKPSSADSVESFQSIFTFYSSMEFYEDNKHSSPFEKIQSEMRNKEKLQILEDGEVPSVPVRRHRKGKERASPASVHRDDSVNKEEKKEETEIQKIHCGVNSSTSDNKCNAAEVKQEVAGMIESESEDMSVKSSSSAEDRMSVKDAFSNDNEEFISGDQRSGDQEEVEQEQLTTDYPAKPPCELSSSEGNNETRSIESSTVNRKAKKVILSLQRDDYPNPTTTSQSYSDHRLPTVDIHLHVTQYLDDDDESVEDSETSYKDDLRDITMETDEATSSPGVCEGDITHDPGMRNLHITLPPIQVSENISYTSQPRSLDSLTASDPPLISENDELQEALILEDIHESVSSYRSGEEMFVTCDDPEDYRVSASRIDGPSGKEGVSVVTQWERPNVPFQTWAERQGIQEQQFPSLNLRHQYREKSGGILLGNNHSGHKVLKDTPSPGPPVDSEKDEHHHAHRNAPHEDKQKEDRTQQDRCVEVYPETVRQRQRNMMASSNKVDIKNWNSSAGGNGDSQTSPAKVKKFLPSVKALRNQFEAGKTNVRSEANGSINGNGTLSLSRKSSNSTSSLASSTLEKTSSTNSLSSTCSSMENLLSPSQLDNRRQEEPVEPIYNQFKKVDEELRELMNRPPSTTGWDPQPLLKRLYYVPEAPKMQSQGTTYINIEGYLEKLPSGRKKATFWNAWKRRYFVAKDGVLYYYQNNQTDKPNMKMPLMGGKVECMEPNMVGVDDGKGHYVVVRCNTRQEAERWRRALETHTVEDFASQYVQPWPIPTNPALLRDTLVIDIGSASIRAGVLASQATLPQVFLPSVVATDRESRRQVWGFDALSPDVRASSCVSFPIRPSHKISKYSVDMSAVSSLLQKTFASLKVDPKNYHVQLSVPRVLNTNTQTELLRVLFDKYGVRSVNLTHQSILALYAYNATSGIIVDIGERMEIVPVIDGYIVDGGVSRVPYGGYRILDHLRQFLYMRNISLINEVESYLIRYVLENLCYCAHHYNTEKARCTNSNSSFARSLALNEYFHGKNCPYESISLDLGRFQATEGLFNPDAWGLDHPGIHKLVHKAIMECSMDIRKEMSRSIFLAGGVTQLPGFIDRLTTEIDNLTPPAIRPKVHASPYRYHASYIGACVLAESPAFNQSRISSEDWNKQGSAALRKWSM